MVDFVGKRALLERMNSEFEAHFCATKQGLISYENFMFGFEGWGLILMPGYRGSSRVACQPTVKVEKTTMSVPPELSGEGS